jgi:hypothetical protein
MSSEGTQDAIPENVKKIVDGVIQLTDKLDEKYREKAFEILLKYLLERDGNELVYRAVKPTAELPMQDSTGEKPSIVEPVLPINVRAFLQQNSIPDETIFKLFLIERGQITEKYKITTTRKSEAQIQVALLTALENAISKQGNRFEFSVETIRTQCQNRGVYDKPNFKAHFKNNSKLFKSLADEEHIELSPEGQTELADVILAVAK